MLSSCLFRSNHLQQQLPTFGDLGMRNGRSLNFFTVQGTTFYLNIVFSIVDSFNRKSFSRIVVLIETDFHGIKNRASDLIVWIFFRTPVSSWG